MKVGRGALRVVVSLLVLAFASFLVVSILWPPTGDFRSHVAEEAAKIALQLLGLTAVGALASELIRDARERRDFALRVRSAYGKAKGLRRRLKRLSEADR